MGYDSKKCMSCGTPRDHVGRWVQYTRPETGIRSKPPFLLHGPMTEFRGGEKRDNKTRAQNVQNY